MDFAVPGVFGHADGVVLVGMAVDRLDFLRGTGNGRMGVTVLVVGESLAGIEIPPLCVRGTSRHPETRMVAGCRALAGQDNSRTKREIPATRGESGLPAIDEIRAACETPPLLALRRHEKARSMSGLKNGGGVQFTTERLAIGANEHC